jgi:transposase, IS30 family
MYTHITRDQRVALAALLREGATQKDVARAIGVHPSTVGRELKRNPNREGYHAIHANTLSVSRRRYSKLQHRKIENNEKLEQRIETMLNPLVSPEVVAHELNIVHETIYAWIYRSRPDLKKKLPYQGRKRRRYGKNRTEKQGWTRDVRKIDSRPDVDFSWEGDTVKGLTRSQLLTHVERESLFAVADLIPNGTADAVQEKMKKKDILKESVLTYDRGSEFALWRMIEKDIDSLIFFANAHHPWERGKNENTNGRLRRVYPKKFNFDTVSQRDIDATVWLMNHTKRKSLGWRTPCRVFGRCCTSD